MTEYYISEMPGVENLFKIAKFDGRDQPENIYFVTMRRPKGEVPEMHCDCPNRRRGKHINDKHGVMVAKWLLEGKPEGHFNAQGEWHGTAERLDAAADVGPEDVDHEPDPFLGEGDEEDPAV